MSPAKAIDKLKCDGCANPIKRNIRELSGVTDAVVDIEAAQVIGSGSGHLAPPVVAALARLGDPPRNSLQGAAAVRARVKSFVSCAIGRLSD